MAQPVRSEACRRLTILGLPALLIAMAEGSPMPAQTVADLIADTLERVGVRRIWGVVGDSLNGLTDSMRRRGTIDWIHTRHEEAAAFAAGAEAHITGQLA